MNASFFGLLNFALDGVKLFSKLVNLFSASSMVILHFVILYFCALAIDDQNGISAIAFASAYQIGFFFVIPILEVAAMTVFSSSQNAYVSISFSRAVEMFAVVEIVLGVVVLANFSLHISAKSSSAVVGLSGIGSGYPGMWLVYGILFVLPLLMIELEKVPFDLVEAESELIDGVTTEFSGFGFSLTYAAEVAGGFLLLKFLVPIAGFVGFMSIFILVGLCFTGRVFLSRFLMSDFMQMALSIGLPLTALLVMVF